jgi:hypothetical protein
MVDPFFARLLAGVLKRIEAHDIDYAEREKLCYDALFLARRIGYPAGFRVDPTDHDWPVLYIQLPTGQVSWHMPQFPQAWDGHDTAEKYARCRAFVEQYDVPEEQR